MKTKYKLLIVFLLFSFLAFTGYNVTNSFAENSSGKYSKVKVFVNSEQDLLNLQMNDINVDEYLGKIGTGIEIVIDQDELNRLRNTALRYEVLIEDMDEYYRNREEPTWQEMQKSEEIKAGDNIRGFSYGSMGGFHTYVEVVRVLDSMRLLYPALITAKQNIGTSHENRIIWAVKISDNPDINESATEPAIHYDAIHHAREPISMSVTLYYMYWLLENYGTDPVATYLVNNREMFFVPVVNPDGYVYNQTTNPNGGGSWRKNRRLNSPGIYGVDLNRNYSYGWGLNSGSSGDPSSNTYRGPYAFSEPESQAVRDFALLHNPEIAFTIHSAAAYYLNPYGYCDTAISYEMYSDFSSEFAVHNDYLYGITKEILNYYSSGTTRDYLHSIGTYAWTPEIGGSGFWPPSSQIIPLCSENLKPMTYLSWVGGAFARFQNFKIPGSGYVTMNDTLELQVIIRNKGLSKTAKNVTCVINSNYTNLVPLVSTVNYDSILARQSKTNTSTPFKFKITSTAGLMDEMRFVCTVKQENVVTAVDTFYINVGRTNVLFSDNAETGILNWTRSGNGYLWDTSFVSYWEGIKSFADSRYGNCKVNTTNYFTLNNNINLNGTVNPRIEFTAKWATESGYDYVRLQISTNNGSTWINMPGRHTTIFSGQPSYIGIKYWRDEQINLNSFIGSNIKIRFYNKTDGGVQGDGFYFDNFRVVDYRDTATSITQVGSEIPKNYDLSQNFPNPFNPVTTIKFAIPKNGNVTLKIFDVMGRLVDVNLNGFLKAGYYDSEFDATNLASGIYFYTLTAGDFKDTKKMLLIK